MNFKMLKETKAKYTTYFLVFLIISTIAVLFTFIINYNQVKEIGKGVYFGAWEHLLAANCDSHNVFGWTYADPIGPISLSCKNCDINNNGFTDVNCGGNDTTTIEQDYGVDINQSTGLLSGYAWNTNIGPISFNPSEICANGDVAGCQISGNSFESARAVYISDGEAQITGWARSIGSCDFESGHCTTNGSGTNAGGWDGWIKFNQTVIPAQTIINSSMYGACSGGVCGGGSIYNTVILTEEGKYKIKGNAWGGVISGEESEATPAAVIGEMIFLDSAETIIDPNDLCPRTPIADITPDCIETGGNCYYDRGNLIVNLANTSSLNSEAGYTCSPNNKNFEEGDGDSEWGGEGIVSVNSFNSSVNLLGLSNPVNVDLTINYFEKSDSTSKAINFLKMIKADFSCCYNTNTDGDETICEDDADFKNCSTDFIGITVQEGDKFYLRDNASTIVKTLPSEGETVATRNWIYSMGIVGTETNTEVNDSSVIYIRPGGVIQLEATDTIPLSDTEVKNLDDIFNGIERNPDFREIPFD